MLFTNMGGCELIHFFCLFTYNPSNKSKVEKFMCNLLMYGDQADDYHSTSGYIYLLANGAILWTSRKQKTVAQSTTEAKYMALADAANQAAWYQSFLSKLGYEVSIPIPLHGDNKGTVDLAQNPVTGRRSKHIPIKHHAIREYVENRSIDLVRMPTAKMLADSLTKLHARARLTDFISGLGLIPLP